MPADAAAPERPEPGRSPWTEAVTSQDGTTEVHHRTSVDVVTFTMADGDGTETRDYTFSIDDYAKREASGDLAEYLNQRAYPKARAGWRPDIREVSRRVDRYVAVDGEWVLEPRAASEFAEAGS